MSRGERVNATWRLLHTPEGAARFCKLMRGESVMDSTYNKRAYQRDKDNAAKAGLKVYEYRKLKRVGSVKVAQHG